MGSHWIIFEQGNDMVDVLLRLFSHWNSVNNVEALSILIWKGLEDTLYIFL